MTYPQAGQLDGCRICGSVGVSNCANCTAILEWLRQRLEHSQIGRRDDVRMTSTLCDDLNLDLFEFVEVISDLRDEFHLTIPDDLEFNSVIVADVVREVRGANPEVSFVHTGCLPPSQYGWTDRESAKQWLSRLFLRAQRFGR